jgi:hypothetical protein
VLQVQVVQVVVVVVVVLVLAVLVQPALFVAEVWAVEESTGWMTLAAIS